MVDGLDSIKTDGIVQCFTKKRSLKMTIQVHEKLLLTGAAGGLGKALRERLKANCSVLRLSDVGCPVFW